MRARRRVHSCRRITHACRPDQTQRTGALSRSTAVPLPVWASAEASQSAPSALTCEFEVRRSRCKTALMFLRRFPARVQIDFPRQPPAPVYLLTSPARPPPSLIHHTSSTSSLNNHPHQHNTQVHHQPWPALSRPPVSAFLSAFAYFASLASSVRIALVLLQLVCRHPPRRTSRPCLCALPHRTSTHSNTSLTHCNR
jgi:hypothetical protein